MGTIATKKEIVNVLGVESSCDETAAAVISEGCNVLSNVVASQIELHARYGGVVPEVASRQHMLSINPVLDEAMRKANVGWAEIDAVAVTCGPGLAGSLLVGLNAGKALAFARGVPLIGVNHMEGHIYANWLTGREPQFPLVCLIVSGGHSDLILMTGHGQYACLGRTRDDAAGEAFDKVARILGLGYPGGPAIQKAAQNAGPKKVRLPRAWLGQSYDFSFSGLKTAVLRLVEKERAKGAQGEEPEQPELDANSIAAGFQESVVEVLVEKTRRAAEEHGAQEVLLAGGVAANALLRQRIVERIELPVHYPPISLCTDNAAMIAAAGYYRLQMGQRSGWDLDAEPGLKLY